MARTIILTLAAAWLLVMPKSACAEPAPFMMRASVNNQLIEGQPLAWGTEQVLLLGRDGALYDFNPADAKDSKKTAKAYVGYTAGEMKALVRAEFDHRFDVSTTSHFVVVHPQGSGAAWGERLESLYRGFTNYMSVRGFDVKSPPTSLVAIVFRNSDEYYNYAAALGSRLPTGTLGHYDGQTNRVYLFNVAGDAATADWASDAETIIHEATHQTAYNVGVHARFADQPRWLVEGLAMMFEAPGVWNAASLHTQADRVNRYRLDYFRSASKTRPPSWIGQLIASDRPFETTTLDAYAAAWALTFYLCETRPQEYSAYLARVASRKQFAEYPPAARVRDFTQIFGADLELLAAQVQRFIDGLP